MRMRWDCGMTCVNILLYQMMFALVLLQHLLCAETGNVNIAKQLLEKWDCGLALRNPLGHCVQLIRASGAQHDIQSAFAAYHTLCKTSKRSHITQHSQHTFRINIRGLIKCSFVTKRMS